MTRGQDDSPRLSCIELASTISCQLGWRTKRPISAGHPEHWNELTYPTEYPLGMNEMSFLLPLFLKERRGVVDTYFTRVYNPVWINPNGFDWVEVLSDENMVGLHAALTPIWGETAYFADYVLPMGLSSERHDLVSTETHNRQWGTFRQPVARDARERLGEIITDTRQVNPGEVWEESEFWLELTWRIDPDGALGIRQHVESRERPGKRISLDAYYGWIFDHSIPGLPENAAAEGFAPLAYMRRYGSAQIGEGGDALYDRPVDAAELVDEHIDAYGRVYTRADAPPKINGAPTPDPEPDAKGRRPVGVANDGVIVSGFPTPSGRLEFYSSTLAQWGWPEYALPTYIKSHIHRDKLDSDQVPLIPTFRLPTQVHTRGANAKWLSELAITILSGYIRTMRDALVLPRANVFVWRPNWAILWRKPGSRRAYVPVLSPAAATWDAGSLPAAMITINAQWRPRWHIKTVIRR